MRRNGGKRRRQRDPVLMKVRSSLSVYTFADGASFILDQHPVPIHHQIYARRPEPSTTQLPRSCRPPMLVTTKDDIKAKGSKMLELERDIQSMLDRAQQRVLYQCEPVPSFSRTHLTPAIRSSLQHYPCPHRQRPICPASLQR